MNKKQETVVGEFIRKDKYARKSNRNYLDDMQAMVRQYAPMAEQPMIDSGIIQVDEVGRWYRDCSNNDNDDKSIFMDIIRKSIYEGYEEDVYDDPMWVSPLPIISGEEADRQFKELGLDFKKHDLYCEEEPNLKLRQKTNPYNIFKDLSDYDDPRLLNEL